MEKLGNFKDDVDGVLEQEKNRVVQALINGLLNTLLIHEKLGEEGLEEIEKNQFGDTALRIDFEAEEAMIDILRRENIPIKIISEEHGTVTIGDSPKFLGVLDGIDGTSLYKTSRGIGRYGTMFGVFDNTDPLYKNYLVSGVMEHATKRLYMATKGGGAFLIEGDSKIPIHVSPKTQLDSGTAIYIDDYKVDKETIIDKLSNFKPKDRDFSAISSSIHYVDLASGKADLVIESTRKSNLEIATAYGLVHEAGGVIATMDGVDIGEEKYLTFGQNEYLPIISAANIELARDTIKYLNI